MNRAPKAQRMNTAIVRAAVVTPEQIALNGLPRAQIARPERKGSNLLMNRLVARQKELITPKRRIDRIH